MRWLVVLVFGWLTLGLELGLREGLRLGATTAAPSFVLPFVVFIAMFAPSGSAFRVALALGTLVDLTTLRGSDALVVIGPHALGFALAASFVSNIRGLVIARNPLTLIVLSVVASLLAHIVVTAIFTFRLLYLEPVPFVVMEQLRDRFLTSLLTGLSAAGMALVLYPLFGLFGFVDPNVRRGFGLR
jgi:cell shape-determining protein MreD